MCQAGRGVGEVAPNGLGEASLGTTKVTESAEVDEVGEDSGDDDDGDDDADFRGCARAVVRGARVWCLKRLVKELLCF